MFKTSDGKGNLGQSMVKEITEEDIQLFVVFFLQGYVVMLAWQMWVVRGFYSLYLRKTRSLYNIKYNV